MAVIINETREALNQLEAEGKTRVMDSPEDMAAVFDINTLMEEVDKDFQIKDSNSQTSSASVILTN